MATDRTAQVAGRGECRRTRARKPMYAGQKTNVNSMYTEPGVADRQQTTQSRKDRIRSRCGGHGPLGARRAAQNAQRKSQAAASAAGRGPESQCMRGRKPMLIPCIQIPESRIASRPHYRARKT